MMRSFSGLAVMLLAVVVAGCDRDVDPVTGPSRPNAGSPVRDVAVSDGPIGCWGDVSAGSVHSCALVDDGSIQCWGNNKDGQLNVPTLSEEQWRRLQHRDGLYTYTWKTNKTERLLSAERQTPRWQRS